MKQVTSFTFMELLFRKLQSPTTISSTNLAHPSPIKPEFPILLLDAHAKPVFKDNCPSFACFIEKLVDMSRIPAPALRPAKQLINSPRPFRDHLCLGAENGHFPYKG